MKFCDIMRINYNNGKDGIPRFSDKRLAERVVFAKLKVRNKFNKKKTEPKGKAEDGAYCPKEKVGQAWSYTKDITKEEDK